MTLSVRIWWPEGTYDAATVDPAKPEWPPAPGRLFAALRAGARTPADLEVLRWLEHQPPPRIHAPRSGGSARSHLGYVVINGVSPAGGNLTHPGRSNGLRSRAGTTLREPVITFVWPDADVSPLTVERLDKLASGVPYLGRSTSPATLSFDDEWKGEPWPAWIPVDLGAGGVSLPVPYAGFVDELDAAYADGRRAWETYRTQDYRFAGGPDEPEETRSDFESPYSAPMVLRFRREQYLAGSSLGILTTALRRAVMSLVPDPLPPAISGHGADGTPHAAYLGLVDVGHRYSDGHVLALGVTGPRNDPRTLELLGQAVLGDPGLRLLRVAQLGDFDLKYDPALARPLGATAQRWVSAARTWTSATPVVLDRHPRGRLTEIDVVTESIVVAGYPSPAAVELSHAPLTPGALLLRRHQVPLRSGDRRPVRHIKITFDRPVRGPVLVGALRHLGFGLFVPSERSPGWKGPR